MLSSVSCKPANAIMAKTHHDPSIASSIPCQALCPEEIQLQVHCSGQRLPYIYPILWHACGAVHQGAAAALTVAGPCAWESTLCSEAARRAKRPRIMCIWKALICFNHGKHRWWAGIFLVIFVEGAKQVDNFADVWLCSELEGVSHTCASTAVSPYTAGSGPGMQLLAQWCACTMFSTSSVQVEHSFRKKSAPCPTSDSFGAVTLCKSGDGAQ